MAKVFINTIVGMKENLSQLSLLQHLSTLNIEIDGIEVRGELFSADKEARKEEFLEIKRIAQKENWELHISYPFDLFDAEGIRAEAKLAFKEAEEQKLLSAKFNTGDTDGISKTTLEEINHLPFEIRIENGQAVENGTIKSVQLALDNISAQNLPIGFTFDMGNWFIMGEEAKQAFAVTQEQITAFHLKNVNESGESILVDEGVISWRELTTLNIPYIIEYPIAKDDIKNEVDKLKQALTEYDG